MREACSDLLQLRRLEQPDALTDGFNQLQLTGNANLQQGRRLYSDSSFSAQHRAVLLCPFPSFREALFVQWYSSPDSSIELPQPEAFGAEGVQYISWKMEVLD